MTEEERMAMAYELSRRFENAYKVEKGNTLWVGPDEIEEWKWLLDAA